MTFFFNDELQDSKEIYQVGSVRLRKYDAFNENEIILFIPSLINRAFILDLTTKTSMIKYFQSQGKTCYLIDWQDPIESEDDFGYEEYVTKRIQNILQYIYRRHRSPISVIGYCMGGLLSMIAALLYPKYIKDLTLIATPWDFQPMVSKLKISEDAIFFSRHILQKFNVIPGAYISCAFNILCFQQFYQRFSRYFHEDCDSSEITIALEAWLNNGINMTNKLASENIIDLLSHNNSCNLEWKIASMIIDPRKIQQPVLVVFSDKDHLVPKESVEPMIDRLANKTTILLHSGHIGMIIGKNAQNTLWQPVIEWINHH